MPPNPNMTTKANLTKLELARTKQDAFVEKMRAELCERYGSTVDLDQVQQEMRACASYTNVVERNKRVLSAAKAKIAEEMANAWKMARVLLFVGFGIDDKSIKRMSRGRAVIAALFHVLLVLTDLDALGFFLSYWTYWTYNGLGQEVVKAILIFFPVAYMGVLLMNIMEVDQEETNNDSGDNVPGSTAQKMMSRPPSPMRMVHFVPIIRGQLYLRQPSPSDIEAIFRINTLSSFSLGVAQFAGMTFYLFVGESPSSISARLTPTIIVNMVSLVCNWSVTILYYCTSIPDKMKDAVAAQSLDSHLADEIQKDKEMLAKTVREVAREVGEDRANMIGTDDEDSTDEPAHIQAKLNEVKRFRRKIIFEMVMLEDVLIDLRGLPVDELEDMRSRVFKKHTEIFRALGV